MQYLLPLIDLTLCVTCVLKQRFISDFHAHNRNRTVWRCMTIVINAVFDFNLVWLCNGLTKYIHKEVVLMGWMEWNLQVKYASVQLRNHFFSVSVHFQHPLNTQRTFEIFSDITPTFHTPVSQNFIHSTCVLLRSIPSPPPKTK